MKKYYQSGAQKRQANGRKIAEAARDSQRLSSWLTRPETSKADEQDVSIGETESTLELVDVSIRETENSDTTKDRSDASKNDDFSTIIVNSVIKRAITAAGPKPPEGPFPKETFQNGHSFSINNYHFVNTIRSKATKILVMLFVKRGPCLLPACWLFSHQNVSSETSYTLQNPWSTTGLNDWMHLLQRIRSHESSTHHAEACIIYEQWRNRGQ